MKLGSFKCEDGNSYGLIFEDEWFDIKKAANKLKIKNPGNNLKTFLKKQYNDGYNYLERILDVYYKSPNIFSEFVRSIDHDSWLPPISDKPRLFTQRGNSCLNSRLSNLEFPNNPVFELRFPHPNVGHNSEFTITPGLKGGWNPELVVVIGKQGKNIKLDNAYDHIAGYTILIDHAGNIEGRMDDWMVDEEDRVLWDAFFYTGFFGNLVSPHPIGPWITIDENINPDNLWVSACEKRNEVRIVEKVHSSALLFSFSETISFLSTFVTLKPGDMISSGSIGYDSYPHWDYYPDGSYIEVEAENIGTLRMNINDIRGGEDDK